MISLNLCHAKLAYMIMYMLTTHFYRLKLTAKYSRKPFRET